LFNTLYKGYDRWSVDNGWQILEELGVHGMFVKGFFPFSFSFFYRKVYLFSFFLPFSL